MKKTPLDRIVELQDYLPPSTRLSKRLEAMGPEELELILAFTEQIMRGFDPDAVRDFLALRDDDRIGSILQIAASLGDEARDQLLFAAEALYMDDR